MSILIKNIGDSFDDLGYSDLNQLEVYLENLNFVNYSKLVHWLSANLSKISPIESAVNEIDDEQEADSFKIELSSLLQELGSPHSVDNLTDLTSKLTILNYLCGELLAATIDYVRESNQSDQEFDETEIAKQLRLILMSLGVQRPPPDVTVQQIFEKITERVDSEFKRKNISIEESLLFKNSQQAQVGEKIWAKLEELNQLLKQEYEMRKRTLITRSDCTVASFRWKKDEHNEELDKKIDDLYHKFHHLLERDISIDLSDLMAVKASDFDQLNNIVISKSHQQCTILPPKSGKLANQGAQQRLSLHKFIIGNVPDRGGRTEEAIKPMKETFSQQKQQREQQNFRNNRGNFQNKAQNMNINPNRVQGSGWNQGNLNWNNQQNYQQAQNYQQTQNYNQQRNFSNHGDYHNRQQQQQYYQSNNQSNQHQGQYNGGHQKGGGGGGYQGNRNDGTQYGGNRGGRRASRY